MASTTSPTDTKAATLPRTDTDTGTGTGETTAPGSAAPNATAPNATAPDWEALVTAALLGTDRRRPPVPVHGKAATAALLDAAAVAAVRRRAGIRPAPPAPLPEPASADPRPALPPAAAHRLAMLLAGRPGTGGQSRGGTAPDLVELLPQWLAAANDRGYAPPPHLVPDLLDAARARTDLRPDVLRFTGPRAVWLARLNPEWKFVLRAVPGGGYAPAGRRDPQEARRLWEEGQFAERVALLAAERADDPQAARELLASTWATERAEDRLMFLDTLRQRLSGDDEPFLEKSLADRSRNVRAIAAEMLSTLPGSALAGRMASRTASCVTLDRTRQAVPTLVVRAPQECDAAMERDGVVPKAPAGRGERSWWLSQLLESTPLGIWPERLGTSGPEETVALPVADDWRSDLHAAWCGAAVRQRDAAWARALLGAPTATAPDGPGAVSLSERARLLAVLPAAERAEWVAGFVAAHGLSEAFQLLGCCATPWSGRLGSAVVDALNIARDSGSYPWSFSGVMGLAERCLDPAQAEGLDRLTAIPEEQAGSSPGAGSYWSEAFQRLTNTLRLRAALKEELSSGEGRERERN